MTATTEKAILAGGCFWGMQDLIRQRPGVVSTRVGYTGGDVPNATYRNHGTHAEAIEIVFDPDADLATASCWSSSSRSTTRPRGTARATTSAPATGRRSSTPTTSSSGSPRTPSPTSMPPGCGPARWSPRSTAAGPFWEAEPEHQDYLERYPERLHLPLRPARLEAAAPAGAGLMPTGGGESPLTAPLRTDVWNYRFGQFVRRRDLAPSVAESAWSITCCDQEEES